MLDQCKVSFIGGGNMAEAMIKGLLNKGLVAAGQIRVAEPLADRCRVLRDRYSVECTADNREASAWGQIVILSVKPQVIAHVFKEIGGSLQTDALALSIVAGASLCTLTDGLQHRQIVRVMPNTPAMIGQGMSVWTTTAEVTELQRSQARLILQALGEEISVDDEEYLNMATALNGTGPAYVFLFMEALIDAGVHLGFSRPIAQQLVLQTMAGSVAFARETKSHPAELRNMVTSPGGTTAEALYELEKGGLRTILSKAVWAAYQKTRHLGGLNNK